MTKKVKAVNFNFQPSPDIMVHSFVLCKYIVATSKYIVATSTYIVATSTYIVNEETNHNVTGAILKLYIT